MESSAGHEPARSPMLLADSVEKLHGLALGPVRRGHSTLGEVAIVDPGSIWEVGFRSVARSSSRPEFFNRIRARTLSVPQLRPAWSRSPFPHRLSGYLIEKTVNRLW